MNVKRARRQLLLIHILMVACLMDMLGSLHLIVTANGIADVAAAIAIAEFCQLTVHFLVKFGNHLHATLREHETEC